MAAGIDALFPFIQFFPMLFLMTDERIQRQFDIFKCHTSHLIEQPLKRGQGDRRRSHTAVTIHP